MDEAIMQQLIISGVGGQGVLFVTRLLAEAAILRGLAVFTSETHGMAQRGGSVMATLRIADRRIHGALIPAGTAGVPFSFNMEQGDMAQVAVQNVGDNPTGTMITSDEDHPIGVFTGDALFDTSLNQVAGGALLCVAGLASGELGTLDLAPERYDRPAAGRIGRCAGATDSASMPEPARAQGRPSRA